MFNEYKISTYELTGRGINRDLKDGWVPIPGTCVAVFNPTFSRLEGYIGLRRSPWTRFIAWLYRRFT